jgi:hypothetical protein
MKTIIAIQVAALTLIPALPREVAADTPPEHTGAQVEAQPPPGYESGRVDREPDEPTIAMVTRGALFVPRIAVTMAFTPVRGAIQLTKRYELVDRYRRLFYSGDGRYGVLPVLRAQLEYGVTVGAKFVHSDLFGAHERLRLRAATGGRVSQSYGALITTGERFEAVRFELQGLYETRVREPFYGIGNGDEIVAAPAPIDVLMEDTAVETRFRRRAVRTWLAADLELARSFHLRPAVAFGDLEFARGSSGPLIDEVFEPMSLIGLDGYRSGYAELELRWDTRGSSSIWESSAVFSRGSLASVFAGRMKVEDGAGLWRYGGDLQHFIRVGAGPRVISGRLHAEAITGSVEEVPFTELPTLGGEALLRGYPSDRFRDRVAAVGSVEYAWDLSQLLTTSLFVDAGRVYSSLDDLSLDQLRVGYGLGLDLHGRKNFLARFQIASSIDGGVFAYVSFDPVFDVPPRVERR